MEGSVFQLAEREKARAEFEIRGGNESIGILIVEQTGQKRYSGLVGLKSRQGPNRVFGAGV